MNEDTLSKGFKYFAFISYKSDDLKEAWALKKKLDGYKLPTLLCKQYNKERKPTYEAFLDKTNIQPGELTKELRDNLDNSHYLIVVCSPRSAKSDYVTAEIEWFTRNGREKEMFLFIIESNPFKIEESFNPAIKKVEKQWEERDRKEGREYVKREILGVNIKEKDVDKLFFLYRWPIIGLWLQRERAYMQLISALLHLQFKQLWSYQKIRLAERMIAWIVGIILVLSALSYTWYVNQPVDVKVRLNEASVHNSGLPPLRNAVVTMTLDNETKTDTIHSIDIEQVFTNIPHRFLEKEVRLQVECRDFLPVDTILPLSESLTIDIRRDPEVYGNLRYRLWNPDTEQTSPNTEIVIDGHQLMSDAEGMVTLTIPLNEQKTSYPISSKAIDLTDNAVLGICGSDDAIIFK